MTQDKIREKAQAVTEKVLYWYENTNIHYAREQIQELLSDFHDEVLEEAATFLDKMLPEQIAQMRFMGTPIRALKSQSTKDGEQ